jgi:anti-sigma B factor antagonist
VSAKLNTREVGDVTVVDVSGRITLGEGSSAMRDTLRELVSGFTTVANAGGTLKLQGLTKRVKDLLQITKLYTVFDVHEDEAHAVRSFA